MTTRGNLEDKKPASLAERAYGLIYADITNGSLAPGQKLLPAELSAKHAVGLSPLRDALNRLCADGLAVKREQKGFFVADLDEAEFLKITDARLVVEDAALRLSIARGDQRWEDGVVLAFHRLAKVAAAGGKFVLTPEWSACHEEFHFSLLAACDNEWLLSFCRKLYEQSSRYRARRRLISAKGSIPVQRNLVKAHRDIMERCVARDADQASSLLVNHYRKTFELVMGSRYRVLDNPLRLVPDTEVKEAGFPFDLIEI
ncbi:GntR family transcriptional regulator [Ancylobacter sonchi]|uniref:GntR family transcriptional regulator n=1 Tax=Ancylobacter sonchi TaxID=1937790 RepID=UPI001BD2CC28|nr:GntR family transcriptional regulator [Ancylobacter sonchi]MBS7532473.1 GntR family transcriptional regulator [Ancylobacter sonchi]